MSIRKMKAVTKDGTDMILENYIINLISLKIQMLLSIIVSTTIVLKNLADLYLVKQN